MISFANGKSIKYGKEGKVKQWIKGKMHIYIYIYIYDVYMCINYD
jgi:hypothetical protein